MSTSQMVALFNTINSINNSGNNSSSATIYLPVPMNYFVLGLFILLIVCFIGSLIFLIKETFF